MVDMSAKHESGDRIDAGGDQFATTRRSVVLAAGQSAPGDSRDALTSLCECYWFPLYTYARRRVVDTNDAQDLTQAFFAEFLEKIMSEPRRRIGGASVLFS